jgi:type II secretory pathway pseudopilin PulG
MYQKPKKYKNAFTILELAVVIIIIAILIFTTINYSNTMSVNAKNRITKDKLKIIYLALGQYLTINKRLPCPITLTTPKNQVMSQSLSNSCGSLCNSNRCYGGVPVKDLDLSAELSEDGFGNKIFYMVNQNYLTSNNFGTSSITNANNFTISEQLNTPTTRTLSNTRAIVVLSSSGANQAYSYRSKNHLTTCGAIANCNYNNIISNNSSEQENRIIIFGTNIYPTNIFVNDYTSPSFDDIVLYKTEDDFSFDFNQFYLQKCSGSVCNNLSYNLQTTSQCITINISQRAKCYQSNLCRFLFDCRI